MWFQDFVRYKIYPDSFFVFNLSITFSTSSKEIDWLTKIFGVKFSSDIRYILRFIGSKWQYNRVFIGTKCPHSAEKSMRKRAYHLPIRSAQFSANPDTLSCVPAHLTRSPRGRTSLHRTGLLLIACNIAHTHNVSIPIRYVQICLHALVLNIFFYFHFHFHTFQK